MKFFTIRVEILNGSSADYDRLDSIMVDAGFTKEINGKDESGNPGVWAMPTGSYQMISNVLSVTEIRELVRSTTLNASFNCWILVSESTSMSWSTRKLRS